MYLFDTDTLSNIVKRRPSGLLLEKLRDLPKALQYTSAINVGEIYYGAKRSSKKERILKAFELKTAGSFRSSDKAPPKKIENTANMQKSSQSRVAKM